MRLLHFLIDAFLEWGNYFFIAWCIIHALIAGRVLSNVRYYEMFIGLRYLKSRRKQVLISVITVLSVLGVTLGVGALIAVYAGMTGFEKDIREKILGANSHLSLIHYQNGGFENWQEARERILSVDGVKAASPYIEKQVLAMHNDKSYGILYHGIDPKTAVGVSDIERAFEQGQGNVYNLEKKDDLPAIALGFDLAAKLEAFIGDEVTVLNPQGGLGPFGLRPELRRYRVVGTFQFGLWEVDSNVAFVNLPEAQDFMKMGESVTGIAIKLSDSYRIAVVANEIRGMFKYPFMVRDWEHINKPLFVALKLEKVLSAWVLGIMVVIASFSIVIALIMVVMEKYRDIAVLKTMGASDDGIRNVFLIHGLVIGVVGTVLGIILGGGLVFSQYHWHWITLDPSVYYISYLPVYITPLDIFKIAVFALSITLYATLYPSYRAARMDPAEALRYE